MFRTWFLLDRFRFCLDTTYSADDVILRYAVVLQYFAHELVGVALDLQEVVVLHFASLTFEFSLGLAPPSFDSFLTL